jgi:hypothetical protein
MMPYVHSGLSSSLFASTCGEIGFNAAKIGLLGAGIGQIGRLIGPVCAAERVNAGATESQRKIDGKSV